MALSQVLARKWVKALEGGRFKQGKYELRKASEEESPQYCCLGVLARIKGARFNKRGFPRFSGKEVGTNSYLNEKFCGMDSGEQSFFSNMNDHANLSFKQIAIEVRNKYLKKKK